jgi:uncharacterized protein (TIGR03435 family)
MKFADRGVMRASVLALLTVLVLASVKVSTAKSAQQAVDARGPQFDVASVKPNKSGGVPPSSTVRPGGLYVANNVTLRTLIQSAFGVRDEQIVGGPDWVSVDRFDVTGKVDGNPPPDVFREQMRPMLARLLYDRFALRTHSDQRELPIYALVLARDDARLGPELKRADSEWADVAARGAPAAPSPIGQKTACGGGFNRLEEMLARAVPFARLATGLSGWVDRIVVDETKLNGAYDWHVKWDPDATPRLLTDAGPGRASDNPIDQQGVSLFTAVREQLGLELKPKRAPIEVVVIDSVQMPSPD